MTDDLTATQASQRSASDAPIPGVYFSANDAVFDWALAFLNSFRTFNPDLGLTLIPFDARSERIAALGPAYRFSVFDDPSFPRLEAIGARLELGLTPYGPNWFRRYAAFWGPYDAFLYLDIRQVILAPIDVLLDAPERYGIDLAHYDVALDQVYRPGAFRNRLLKAGGASGFNSGRWASRRGLFSLAEFERIAGEAVARRADLNPRNTDQAFFNLCCDLKGVSRGHIAELEGDLCMSAWACQPGSLYRDPDGAYRLWDHGGLDHRKRMILLHWAGIGRTRGLPHAALFHRYRTLRMSGIRRVLALSAGIAGDMARRAVFAPIKVRWINRLAARFRRPR